MDTELLQGARFQREAARLTGYDVQAASTIERLDEALPWAQRRIAPKTSVSRRRDQCSNCS
jgi:hypothetical protein